MKNCFVYFAALAALFSTGCASVFFNDYKQVVLVQSDPPGVEIFGENGEKLGVTPAYVKIRRAYSTQLTLRSSLGEVKSVSLKGHYRWSPSFYGNLVYVTLAPVGWGIDLATRTALQFENPGVVAFERRAKGHVKMRAPAQVIAPPQAEYHSLSLEAAKVVEEELKRRFPRDHVIDYEKSRPTFTKFHYRNDVKADKEYLEKILYELDADQYVETTVNEDGPNVKMDVVVFDAFSRKAINSFSLERPREQFKVYQHSGFVRFLSKHFTFSPNAVGIDFTSYSSTFDLSRDNPLPDGTTQVEGERVSEKGFDQWLSWIGSLNILYVRPPHVGRGWDFNLLFIPNLYLAANTFRYPQLVDIKDVEFRRFRMGGGYGPQLSASSRYGIFYFTLMPTYNYTNIRWDVNGGGGRSEMGEFLLLDELGYQLYLSNSLAIRLFGKAWAENTQHWSGILTDARKKKTELTDSTVTLIGVSVIWYWPGLRDKTAQMFSFE